MKKKSVEVAEVERRAPTRHKNVSVQPFILHIEKSLCGSTSVQGFFFF